MNLFALLNSAGGSIQTLQNATSLLQNNVSNASTPGFARLDPTFNALTFDPANNLVGGVANGTPQNSRNLFAEQSVRNEVAGQGYYSQLSSSLSSLDSIVDVSGKTGISGSMNQLFQAFSAWSTTPDSQPNRQAVLTAAENLGVSFQKVARQVDALRASTETDISSTVAQINQLASKIAKYNEVRRSSTDVDPALEADLHTNLEALSGMADIVPLFQADGTVNVLLGGQTGLVMGDHVNAVKVGYPADPAPVNAGATSHAAILSADGTDITSTITEGKLGALLEVRNHEIPALVGDSQQAGSLNTLAAKIADRVNTLLNNAGGPSLFTYDTTKPTGVAASLTINSTITADQLVAQDAGPPAVSNGTALKLAALGTSSDAADQIQGLTVTNYLGSVVSKLGQSITDAKAGSTRAASLVAQAQSLRAQVSGVSLDQEAIRLVELQRSYQAVARVVSIVDQMTSTLIAMFP